MLFTIWLFHHHLLIEYLNAFYDYNHPSWMIIWPCVLLEAKEEIQYSLTKLCDANLGEAAANGDDRRLWLP